jgi:hypothetical protein
MGTEPDKTTQTIWAALLTAMGLLLCFKTPPALEQIPGSGFLSFARYFIGIFLIVGGIKKFYGLYFAGFGNSSATESDRSDESEE